MTEQPKDGGAAFDLAQMTADRDAGTPGEFSQTGLTVYSLMPWGWKRGVEQFCNRFSAHVQGGYGATEAQRPSDDELLANARRIARVPLLEVEIIRLTARVAELEGAISYIADGFGLDAPAFASPIFEDDDSPEDYEWIFEVIRAALSTHTEEIKV